jgi:hypothetical protein
MDFRDGVREAIISHSPPISMYPKHLAVSATMRVRVANLAFGLNEVDVAVAHAERSGETNNRSLFVQDAQPFEYVEYRS